MAIAGVLLVLIHCAPLETETYEMNNIWAESGSPVFLYSYTSANGEHEEAFYVKPYSAVTALYPNTAYTPFAHERNIALTLTHHTVIGGDML